MLPRQPNRLVQVTRVMLRPHIPPSIQLHRPTQPAVFPDQRIGRSQLIAEVVADLDFLRRFFALGFDVLLKLVELLAHEALHIVTDPAWAVISRCATSP